MPQITIKNAYNEELANIYEINDAPLFVWLCGFNSDMSGSKATIMAQFAKDYGFASLRFDYSGTGNSQGNFDDGTISKWYNDAICAIEATKSQSIILVGSSMGGWISLKLAKHFGNKIKALILIAPAPDFTQDLMWNQFPESVKMQIINEGFWYRPSPYEDYGYKITRKLIEDGQNNLILTQNIEINAPIRILHGVLDEDVPFTRSIDLIDKITSENIKLTLIKNGDHRLSQVQDLQTLYETLKEISKLLN
jgi:pimeloyl-ACP methyl ester carboxylesterase